MKRRLFLAAALMALSPPVLAQNVVTDQTMMVGKAKSTVERLRSDPNMERNIAPLLARARAVLIVPDLVKGGFLLGAEYGTGVLLTRDAASGRWSGPAFYSVASGSIGLQIGLQDAEAMFIIMTDGGLRAVMGAVAAEALGVVRPRVALLNVGTEAIKGNQQVKLAASLLLQARELNYVGFVEGDGLYRGEADVVVCDGFVGNIVLKASEGLASMIAARVAAQFAAGPLSRLVGLLALPLLRRLQGELRPARHNGASFLGLQGIVVKSHGAAGPEGFRSAIRRALTEVDENLPQRLHGRLEHLLL